ncbi:formin-binding protein [Paramarasmius palmivorus]|uniref:Formin-binding protein n=1 Tax=Paramarasmius palmivorus TaxID=297713 RepID=A0AAW0DR90_9AGAR
MAVRTQSSASSLAKYAVAKSPGDERAARTTDALRTFWKERAAIEEEYAKKLYELSRPALGKDETGELRNALDTLHTETEKMAKAHLDLSQQIRSEMEDPTTALLNKQIEHRRAVQNPVEKKFKTKQAQESYVVKAREKYEGDRLRIASYSAQIEQNAPDLERIKSKLKRAEQTVGANEKDYANFCKVLADSLPSWENDWKDFCDSCQDMEEERFDFMKDNLWAYANAVSVVCVADDVSCEAIRTVLDQLETDRDLEHFVQEYGTGNAIPNPPEVMQLPHDASSSTTSLPGNLPPLTTSTRPANFQRKSRRPPQAAYNSPIAEEAPPPQNALPVAVPPPAQQAPITQQSQASNSRMPPQVSQPPVAPPPPVQEPPPPPPATKPPTSYQSNGYGGHGGANLTRRASQPLPPQPPQAPYPMNEQAAPPPPDPPRNDDDPARPILFYVEALYDYTATIDEEFSFQAGDIIAVTATPDDGWWSGELLDENRRVEGRHVFPSNFVRLF